MQFSALAVLPTSLKVGTDVEMVPLENKSAEKIHLSGEDKHDIATQLQRYAEIAGPKFRSEEKSAFMNQTLKVAARISADTNVSESYFALRMGPKLMRTNRKSF